MGRHRPDLEQSHTRPGSDAARATRRDTDRSQDSCQAGSDYRNADATIAIRSHVRAGEVATTSPKTLTLEISRQFVASFRCLPPQSAHKGWRNVGQEGASEKNSSRQTAQKPEAGAGSSRRHLLARSWQAVH